MKFIKTNAQMELSQAPTKLEVLREINKRKGLEQDKKLKDEYERLEKGFEGEQDLVKYLKKYGDRNWTILRNVWLDYFGEFEIDVLLITSSGLYTFEVKNYTGKLELINSRCLMNGHSIGHNPFSQAQKIPVQLKEIFKQQSNKSEIQGVLTFIGENNSLHIQDSIAGINVLCRNELRHYIWQIAQEERNYLGYPVDVDTILSVLSSYEIGKPSKEKEIPQKIKEDVQKGVCCCHCGNFDVEIHKSYVICSCGMCEPKKRAILRTICEYGILNQEKNLTTAELTLFFDGFITRKTVNRYLNKFFDQIGTNKNTAFLNKKRGIKEIDEFDLKEKMFFKLN